MNQGWGQGQGQGPYPQQAQQYSQHSPPQYPPSQYPQPQQYPQQYPPGYAPQQATQSTPPPAQYQQGYAQQPPPGYGPQPGYAPQPQAQSYAPPPAFVAPPEQPASAGFSFQMSLWTKIRLALAVGVAIPATIWGFWTSNQQSKSFVVFENSLDAAVEVSVDGKSIGSIPAHGSVSQEVLAGSHAVVVTGGGKEQGTFAVPQKQMFRGLYAIGAKGQVAVVTKYYSESGDSPFDDKIAVIPAGTHFTELPDNMSTNALVMDKPFPDTIPVTKGAMAVSVVHLCHVDTKILDENKEPKISCAGY